MARKKPNKRKGGAGSRSRVRGKAGVRVHQRSATSGAYVVRDDLSRLHQLGLIPVPGES